MCFPFRVVTAVVIGGMVLGRRFLSLDCFVIMYKDVLRVGCFSVYASVVMYCDADVWKYVNVFGLSGILGIVEVISIECGVEL